jgi:hypothetical protein
MPPGAAASEPPKSNSPRKPLPRLMLAPLEPAELLFERLQEPSDESPILYRERAYLVEARNSDDDLEEHLEAELSRIRRDWRHRDASQFVQLSLFDHRFSGEPHLPPIATLSWKDWQGRSEIWVRGVRRSTVPPGVSLDSLPPSFPRGKALPRFSVQPTYRVPPGALDLLEEVEAIEDGDPLDELETVEALDELDEPGDDEPNGERAFGAAAFGSGAPAPASEAAAASARSASEPIPLVSRSGEPAPESRRISFPPASEGTDGARQRGLDGAGDAPPDSGPGWQSPEKSGEYLIPLSDDTQGPPSSNRVVASEELIGTLFERMHELASVMTVGAGADYVMGTLTEHIRCDGALIHVLDAQSGELVVLRAVGPNSRQVLSQRTRPDGSHLAQSLRNETPLELGPNDIARSPGVWPALGLSPRYVIASPIHRREQPVGVIELCRSAEKGPFSEGQLTALEYVCEQFAEFVADRPLEVTGASSEPPPA